MANNKNLVIKIDIDSSGVPTAFKAIREEANKAAAAIEHIGETKKLEEVNRLAGRLDANFKQLTASLNKYQQTLDKLNAGKMPAQLQMPFAENQAKRYVDGFNAVKSSIADIVNELNKLDRKLADQKGRKLAKDYAGGTNLKQTLLKENLIAPAGDDQQKQYDAFIREAHKQQKQRFKELNTITRTLDESNKKGLVDYNREQEKQDTDILKRRDKFDAEQLTHRERRQADIQSFDQQANQNATSAGIDPVGLQRQQRQNDIEEAFRQRDARNAQVERRLQDASQARRNRSQSALSEISGSGSDQQRIQLEVANANAIRLDGERSYRARRAQYALDSFNAERRYETELTRIRNEARSGTLRAPQARQQHDTALENYRTAMQGLPDLNEPIRQHQSLFLRVAALTTAYRTLNLVTSTVTNGIKSIPKVGIELDSARASLEATTGSVAGAESSLKALNAEATRTGINIGTLRSNFAGFQASTSLAGASLESTWGMFTNLDTVITGLHLSADKANGVFLAMAQIFNKGRVQSEELVKQLGNLLPGAFASFAKSMGILPAELSKQMKAGLVEANAIASNGKTIMENFTAYMAERFAPAFAVASQGLNANLERMETSFTHLGEAMYTKMQPAYLSLVKTITSATDSFTGFINGTNRVSDSMSVTLFAASAVAVTGLVGLVLQLGKTVTAINLATFAMGAFSPQAAIITGIGAAFAYLATQAYSASQNIGEAEKALKLRKEEEERIKKQGAMNSATTPLEIQLENDPAYVAIKSNLEKANKEIETLNSEKKGYGLSKTLKTVGEFAIGKYVHTVQNFNDVIDTVSTSATNLVLPVEKTKHHQTMLASSKKTQNAELVNLEVEKARIEGEMNEAKQRAKNATLEAHAKNTSDWLESTSQYEQEPGSVEEAKIIAGHKFKGQNKKILGEAKKFVTTYENINKLKAEGKPVEEGVQGTEENYRDAKQAIANIETGLANAVNEAAKTVQTKIDRQAAISNAKDMRVNLAKEKVGAGLSTAESKAQLETLNTQYVQHKITIEKYYADKQKIQLDDLKFQKDATEKEVEIAKKGNDATRQAKLEGVLGAYEAKETQIKEKNAQDSFKAQEALDKKAGGGGEASTAKEAVRVDIKEQENAIKLLTKETKSELDKLDTAYKANEVSIYTYYARTLNIQLDALDKKKQVYEQEHQIAVKASNDVKATELAGKIEELAPARESLLQTNQQNKVAALDDYNNQLQQALAEERQLMGNEEEGALIRYQQQHKDFREKLNAILREPLTAENAEAHRSATAGLHAYTTGETQAGFSGGMSGIEKSSALVLKQHQERKQNIESMGERGAYSPMFTQLKLMKENKDAILKYEKELKLAEAEQDKVIAKGQKPTEQGQLRIETMRSNLSLLKEESRSVGDEVVRGMGKAFDSSFSGLLTGATNGKMAFRQFAISVEQDLANIAAAEIRSIIFNSLGLTSATGIGGGGLLKSIGDKFGSGAASGATSGAVAAVAKNADGGMYASSDLSQYSGSLVNSPTVFKFASGSSTGLMGEAGPEFILPAERMKNGKMGIRASGGGGGNVTIKNMSVSLQQAPNSTPAQQSEMIAKGIRKQLSTMIQQQTANNLRSGNLLNPTQMQVGM